ncbi:PTS sugar transporter subunit IIB [Oceanobacillus sp. FSL W8-0428]|uniref:PTS mannose transporter subunit IIA n=1 Tax=Oceanobacillus sojae TaxID=582851 RepID=A0A511ZHZ6_9BACI|nr:PTS sugar transporter subunit IIB [Oceanobacillus sojae]GEN87060.1 PTS mannose transporter subunit IIA [Oceanobacillus sojae]
MIKLVRIDDRLIHGQVAYTWTGYLGANVILIANDQVLKDELKKMALNLAAPSGVKVLFKSLDESIEYLNSDASSKLKIFVLVDKSADALKLVKGVKEISSINVGGMRMSDGKEMRTPSIAVDEQDINHFKEMEESGVQIEIRQTPVENKKPLAVLLNK